MLPSINKCLCLLYITDLKKRADQERQYKQRSPKSNINRVNGKPKKGESATPDVSRLPYRHTEGKRSKNHEGGAEEEECVEVPHDDVSGSRTSVAIATALSSKQPRRSATAREKNRVSSDLLNSGTILFAPFPFIFYINVIYLRRTFMSSIVMLIEYFIEMRNTSNKLLLFLFNYFNYYIILSIYNYLKHNSNYLCLPHIAKGVQNIFF